MEAAVPVAGKVPGNKKVKFQGAAAGSDGCVVHHVAMIPSARPTRRDVLVDKNGYRITDHDARYTWQGPGIG